jgi:transposase
MALRLYLLRRAEGVPSHDPPERRQGTVRDGNPYLRATLTLAAWATSRTRDTYLWAKYDRITASWWEAGHLWVHWRVGKDQQMEARTDG